MNRIEYLINNPYEVEERDLDLLNTEIGKHPYFYSLRALKLITLQKINSTEFEKQLEVTSIFNNSINLFHLINHSSENEINDFNPNEIIENDVQQGNDISINNQIETISNKVENEINDFITNEIIENDVQQGNDISISNQIETISIEVENEINDFITNEIIENDVQQGNDISISNQIEDISIEVENEINDFITNEIIQNEVQQESNISINNQVEDISIEVENEINDFITNEIIQTNEIISQAIQETKEVLLTSEILNDIEQVDLINRSTSSENFVQEIFPVTNTIPFIVLNQNNEIVRETFFIQKMADEISISSDHIPEVHIEITEPVDTIINEPEVNLEKDSLLEQEKNQSFSFNEWLKLPSSNLMNTQQEKEQKFQIIEDFLEKNPKITPLKKQDIPEYRNEAKNVKQTDFSDLMTETLAQIYIEQKQYEKAIKAYKILILKYPEKNSLFAKQIKEIENLKNSK